MPAADVDLGARLGVREEARAEPQLAIGAEQLAHEREQRALEIGERDALADHQPFDLREHRRVRQVEVVAAVDAARRDRAGPAAGASPCSGSASPRCACAAASPASRPSDRHRRREVQRVLHVARGMLGRHVQRFEVVAVVFDLGPFDDEEAHAREDRFDAARGGASADGDGRARGARPGSVTSTAPAGGRAALSGADALGRARFDLPASARWRAGRVRGRSSGGAEPSAFSSADDERRSCGRGSDRGRRAASRRRAGRGELALELRAKGVDLTESAIGHGQESGSSGRAH